MTNPTPMTREQAWETAHEAVGNLWTWTSGQGGTRPDQEVRRADAALAFLRTEMERLEARNTGCAYSDGGDPHRDCESFAGHEGPHTWELQATVERLEGERRVVADQSNDENAVLGNALIELKARAEAAEAQLAQAREALREIAALTDGQEGRSAQTMMMHGFSPVKALGQARDIARSTLEQGDKDA